MHQIYGGRDMSVVISYKEKEVKKGYIGIDLDNGLVQYKQSMNGAIIDTLDTKKNNVYVDIAGTSKMGVFNDLRTLAGLAINSKADCDKRVKELKRSLGDQRLLYDLLYSDYIQLLEKYNKLRDHIVVKAEEEPPEVKWWEQYT